MTPSDAKLSVAAATRTRCAFRRLNAQTHRRPRRLGHVPAARAVDAQPVAELRALVQVGERLEPDDAEEAPRAALADGEAQRARVVPVAGARPRSSATRRRGPC